ncbi:hypothetical protein EPX42_19115, partial [Salmonella enterica]|nr:hypothetical protein [Salmonella enterica]EAP8664774.1 hypothetical protein [Salmonella enterica]EAZ9950056.1 hypothetical protein [Salmonella enterica subsp. enterica serovar Typhimurium]
DEKNEQCFLLVFYSLLEEALESFLPILETSRIGRKLSSATLKVLNKLVSGETLDKAINQSLTLKSDVIMVEKCIFFNRLDSIF